MPGTVAEGPSVSMSCKRDALIVKHKISLSNSILVANNFWGKDDAGLQPMLDRMHASKVTSDELKAFYGGTPIPTGQEWIQVMLTCK